MPEAVAEPVQSKAKKKTGRPKAGESPALQKQRTFFEKCREISNEDWGSRANIHLYRLEPYTDRLRSGNVVFIMKYAEPIDEERILADHGSGRYRAMLSFRKPSAEKGDELDRIEFELLNTKFPPKVPKGEWVDDPRNKKWAWARNFFDDHDPPPQPSGGGTVIETLRVLNEVQDNAERRLPKQESFADTIKAVKEILPSPPAPSAENGLLNSIVTLLTTQMTQNGQLLLTQLKSAQDEIQRLRESGEKKGALDMLKEGAEIIEKVAPTITKFFPGLKNVAENGLGGGRSRMSGWQEFLQPIVSDVLQSPVMQGLGQLLVIKASQAASTNGVPTPQPPTVVNGTPQVNAAHGPANFVQFLDMTWPTMRRYLTHYVKGDQGGWEGSEFAAWLWDGYGCPYNGMDWLAQAKLAGAIAIVTAFKQSPYWKEIAILPNGEIAFGNFVTSFIGWEPPSEAEDAQHGEVDDEEEDDEDVVDLRTQGAGAL